MSNDHRFNACYKLTRALPLADGDARTLLSMENAPDYVVAWRDSTTGRFWAFQLAYKDLFRALCRALRLTDD